MHGDETPETLHALVRLYVAPLKSTMSLSRFTVLILSQITYIPELQSVALRMFVFLSGSIKIDRGILLSFRRYTMATQSGLIFAALLVGSVVDRHLLGESL